MTAFSRHPVRRTAAVAAGCGALLVSGLTAPPGARAAGDIAYWGAEISVSTSSISGPGSCVKEGVEPSVDDVLAPGTPTETEQSSSYTITHTEDAGDTQSFTAENTARWSLKRAAGGFKSLEATAQGSVSGESALGDATNCRTTVRTTARSEGRQTLPADGFLTLDLKTTDEMSAGIAFETAAGQGGLLAAGPGSIMFRGGTGTLRTFVEAGQVFFYSYAQVRMTTPEYDDDVLLPVRRRAAEPLAAGTASASLRFIEAGSTMGKTKGKGKKYVKLVKRTCKNDKVVTKMTAKAKQAAEMTYYVDGSRAKKVNKPKKGKTVKLAVPSVSDVEVGVDVELKNGKHAWVTRDFVACTG